MRNLTLVDHRRRVSAEPVPSSAILCVDPVTHDAYMVHTEGVHCFTENPLAAPSVTWHQHGIVTRRIVSAECVSAAAAAAVMCVLTAEGHVITVSPDGDGKVEVMGDITEGITGAAWSPDQELLAATTSHHNLILMTAQFDVITRTPLTNTPCGQPMVSLGWGRKETQFHGSEGKAAAARTKQITRPAPDWDDGRVRVSWRGDGEVFAVGYIPEEERVRRVVIFTREGTIQSIAEDIDGLEMALAWKPSGGVMAATQTHTNKHEVIFIEKNGLKHGSFALPFQTGRVEVVEVVWSTDSTVLAVWGRPLKRGEEEGKKEEEEEEKKKEEEEEVIQLWMCGNYHWYLKREITFGGRGGGGGEEGGGGGERILSLCWVEEASPPLLTLHVLTSTTHHRFTLLPAPQHTQGHSPQDMAMVGVVDGPRLLLTPFRHTTVPPPMSAHVATFPHAISGVCFYGGEGAMEGDVDDSGFLEGGEEVGIGCNALLVQHGHNILTLLAPTPPDQPLSSHGCVVEATGVGGCGFRVCVRSLGVYGQCTLVFPEHIEVKPARASDLYHWAWPRKDTLLAVFGHEHACYVVLIELQVEAGRAIATHVLPVEDWVVAMAATHTMATLQLASGALVKLDMTTRAIEPFLVGGVDVTLPATCQKLSLCQVEGAEDVLPLALTTRGRLYLGHTQLVTNCTSFHVHTHHLLATTAAHTLLATPMTLPALTTMGQARAGVRAVERGSRIVTAVSHDTRVVLQMPRGNLEVVSPRPLAIHTLARLLDTRQYGAAVDMARRHFIDANLLYDHQPAEFLAAAEHFVRDVASPQRIDVFLATLTETDSTGTTYAFHYPDRAPTAAPGKVVGVCEALRAAMVTVDEDRHLLPILTSLVKAGHMEAALAKVGQLRDTAGGGGADDGLRHLLYLADTEELYRVALGTYDLALALMVAQRSSKDPKEYLPQLNGLREMEPAQRRFRIDVMLKRYHTALQGLDDTSEQAEEALDLVEAKGLYALALQLFPSNSGLKMAVCERYGQYLLDKNRPGEAAIMLGRAGLDDDALDAYRAAGNWQMALVCAAKLDLAKDRVVELCHCLAVELRDSGRHLEAARLYEQHLDDEEEAVECLAVAGEWQDALRLTHKHDRPDLIETNIRPSALQQAANTRSDIKETTATLTQQTARLGEVRKAKEKQHAASLLTTIEDGQLDSDLYSDTSTVSGHDRRTTSTTTGSSSSRSQRSSKKKRKLERKKYSTKEGSPQEDLGIIAALHETYTSLAKRAEAVSALCTALITLDHDTEAATLQDQFSDLLKLALDKTPEVWPPVTPPDQDDLEFGPQMTTEGAVQQMRAGCRVEGPGGSYVALRMAELDPHLRYPPPPPKATWKLGLLVSQYKGD